MLVAAPLIAWSRPLGVLLWAFPRPVRLSLGQVGHRRWFSSCWSAVSSAIGATFIQTIALWLWHAPAFFNRALLSESWHAAQHISLVFSALLFWWSMSRAAAERRHGVAAFWLFFTSLQSGLLGALMSFAEGPWYVRYAELGLSGTFGLTPLEDQQLAGLIMWIPGGAIHAIVAFWYLHRWLKAPGRALTTTTVSVLIVALPLAEVDPATFAIVRAFPAGSRVWNIDLSPDGRRLYAAAGLSSELTIVDLQRNQVAATLKLGGKPWGVVASP
jgi:YVTN family beta-propeller protein